MLRTIQTLVPALLLVSYASPGLASDYLEGTKIRISYNDQGTWNVGTPDSEDVLIYDGLEGDPEEDGQWVDFTGSGTPWQHVIVSYTKAGARKTYYGSYLEENTNWTVLSQDNLSTPDDLVSEVRISAGDLVITKTESWGTTEAVVDIDFEITNDGTTDVEDVNVLFVVDPDQDYDLSDTPEDGRTLNDSLDLINSDGENDFALGVGDNSGYGFGLGVCDPSKQEVGHSTRNPDLTEFDYALQDKNGALSDLMITWRHVEDTLAVDDSIHARLLVVVGSTESVSEDLYQVNAPNCATCDADGDGYEALVCGGDDCDDEDPSSNPGMEETFGDEVDNDCDGIDDGDDNDLDGVLDEYEADAGMDYTTRDSDGDGYLDGEEVGDDPANPQDTDGDGTINALDTDDDDDGVLSSDEVRSDSDADGLNNYLDDDDDDDGIPTLVEGEIDTDGDGASDYLDRDSDDDDIQDAVEGEIDTDGDGAADYVDTDSDADGKLDDDEETPPSAAAELDDKDCDTLPNFRDSDDTDGPCYDPPFEDYRGGAGATCSTVGATGAWSWLGLGALAAALLRRRR